MDEEKPKRQKGGRQPGAGRPKGSTSKLSTQVLLDQINKTCGKPFEQLLAEGYLESIVTEQATLRQAYEKMILGKVLADKAEVDHTSLGQAITNVFTFKQQELDDWREDKDS